jgi:hypothetical protein
MDFTIFLTGGKVKDYKVRQFVFNRLKQHEDFVTDVKLVKSEFEIIDYGIRYFFENLEDIIYPSKSYSVSIIYAHLINNFFKVDFYESLNDPSLFCFNDKFFRTYQDDPLIYDAIIAGSGVLEDSFTLDLNLLQVAKTVEYFKEEFGV